MLKQRILKLVIGLAIIASLLGGIALGAGATVAKVAPTHHQMACGAVGFPPCELRSSRQDEHRTLSRRALTAC